MLSIVVPCLNHFEVTKRCLASIIAHTPGEFELIIVDDGSDDDTRTLQSEGFTGRIKYQYIRHDTNLGFSKSVNDGIMASSGELIAIFNNDMIVSPMWLDPLIRVLDANNNYGMVTSTLIEPDHCSVDDFACFLKKMPIKSYSLRDTKIEPWSKGGPWLFRSGVFSMVGLFDEGFLHTTYEDWDYLVRMAIKGIKHGRVINSFVYHYASLTQKGELKKRAGSVDYQQINKDYFYKKWGTVCPNYLKIYTEGKVCE